MFHPFYSLREHAPLYGVSTGFISGRSPLRVEVGHLRQKEDNLTKHDEKILTTLYSAYPEPRGYNQLLREAKVNKKVLDARLVDSPKDISLVYRGLVQVKKGLTRNSLWKITLTENGRSMYLARIGGRIENAFELVINLPEEKMHQTLRKIMAKVFNDLLTRKGKIVNFQKLDTFLKALEEPYMDLANKPLKGIRFKNSMQPYYLARFIIDKAPWQMLRYDALLALKNNHWISPTRIHLLATLGIRTESFLVKHNKKWLARLQEIGKDPDEQKEEEYKAREPEVKKTYSQVFITMRHTQWADHKYF